MSGILFDVGDTLLRVGPFEVDLGPSLAAVLQVETDGSAACRRASVLLHATRSDDESSG